MVLAVIGVLLVIWLAFIVVGALFHAVFWLIIVGAVLFVGTAAYGALRRRRDSALPR